jgi:hypothetical protein
MNSIVALFTADDLSTFKLIGRGVLLLGIITLLSDYIGYRKNGEFGDFLNTAHPYVGVAIAVACYFGVTILGKREGTEFIYFQF